MKGRMKECFSTHSVLHVVLGFGLGIVLVPYFPELGTTWVGLALIVAAWGIDYMQKN